MDLFPKTNFSTIKLKYLPHINYTYKTTDRSCCSGVSIMNLFCFLVGGAHHPNINSFCVIQSFIVAPSLPPFPESEVHLRIPLCTRGERSDHQQRLSAAFRFRSCCSFHGCLFVLSCGMLRLLLPMYVCGSG